MPSNGGWHMEFVRWATGSNDPYPWWVPLVAWPVLIGGALMMLWNAWTRE